MIYVASAVIALAFLALLVCVVLLVLHGQAQQRAMRDALNVQIMRCARALAAQLAEGREEHRKHIDAAATALVVQLAARRTRPAPVVEVRPAPPLPKANEDATLPAGTVPARASLAPKNPVTPLVGPPAGSVTSARSGGLASQHDRPPKEETMQLPGSKTSVSKCLQLGSYCQTMLSKFPANAALVELTAKVGAATGALSSAQLTYAQAVMALVAPRVEVKFADYTADTTVRATMRAVEGADGTKGGKIANAVFPGGVTPIVRPVGATQVSEMRKLEGRLEAATTIWPDALAEKAKVTSDRVKYEAALDARKAAMELSADKRSLRDAAKEDFLDVYASAAGRVKAEFPRHRVMQDLFFDKVTDASAADDGGDDPDEEDGAPGAEPPAGAGSPPGAPPPAANPA